VEARLVVLATGLGHSLRKALGIGRRVLFPGHSVTFGFNVDSLAGPFPFGSLTYYGEELSHRIDYLSLFPARGAMRANLFTFVDPGDPWIAAFRREPKANLLRLMPGLPRFLRDFAVSSRVETGVMDLYVVEGHRRDGVVLIGDAFQTSCPAAGTGVSRLLSDIDRLCTVHLPRWLATPGMPASKIAEFYDDPVKAAVDAKAARLAQYRRLLSTEPRLSWEVHRRQVRLRRRVVGWLREVARPRPVDLAGPL
jgi:2-polyprenyl-6-methoxyphenol hydroxylase-like FAD-dependent oxidoreductase